MRRRALVALGAALSVLSAVAACSDTPRAATFLQSYTWVLDDPAFGGLSGIELAADGARFVAVGDRGHIATGTLDRTDGRITGISAELRPLRDTHGALLGRYMTDAEGLAQADGAPFVSFEGDMPRLWSYPTPDRAKPLPLPAALAALQRNSGIEALAVDAGGALYAIPERSGGLERPFPVWRYDDGRWTQPFAIPRSDGFLAVGADFGPDGRLYLLERAFNGFGFRSRVRAFTLDEAGIAASEVLVNSRFRRHDNLEGLSVWRDDLGRIRLTMISDDNFRAFQRTEIVEYALPLALASTRGTP